MHDLSVLQLVVVGVCVIVMCVGIAPSKKPDKQEPTIASITADLRKVKTPTKKKPKRARRKK